MTTGCDSYSAAWQIREQDFPLAGPVKDPVQFLLRYAVLAPSGHNSQPWRFAASEDEIQVVADKARWLRAVDPNQRRLHIALGCALENLLVATEHFGYGHRVVYFPKPDREDLVASVKLIPHGGPSSFRDPAFFDAITVRHTNRKIYEGRPIPESELERLTSCCVEQDIWLQLIDDEERKRKVKDLLIRGHAITLGDPAFRRETAEWIGRGIFNMPWPLAKIAQWTLPYLDVSSALALVDAKLVMSASALVVIGSNVDGRESQMKVGQVFERICLAATQLGIRVQPMSPIVEIPELNTQVAKLLRMPQGVLQHAFRLGYAKPVARPAPRRPFGEVVA